MNYCGSLRCDSTNCAHNQNHECKAGHIHVSGFGAVCIEGTSCTSFVDKHSSSLTNSLHGDPREKESFFNSSSHSFVNSAGDVTTTTCNIECEAHNCKYNNDKACYAENVKIDAHDAYCDSFDYEDHI